MAVIGEYSYAIGADLLFKSNSTESVEMVITLETEIDEKAAHKIIWAVYPNTMISNFKMEKIET